MKGRVLQIAVVWAAVALFLGVTLAVCAPAKAVTLGSSFSAAANDSVCKFQSFEPETRVCTVEQAGLLTDHTAAGGLLAPFDGVIVRWSVVTGAALPGTGRVTLALRGTGGFSGSDVARGPDVELPSSPPGTRHTFAEQLSISAGQPIGLTISIANRSTQAAGAPIAFQGEGVGRIDIWTGQAGQVIWDTEEDAELLLNAEIEPDTDHDGLGDLTQDCFPGQLGRQELCGHDLVTPEIQPQVAVRQPFLRTGAILARIASTEAGHASAEGWLEIKGRGGWSYRLRSAGAPIAANSQAVLRLRVRKPALKAARVAKRNGTRVLVKIRVGVSDAAGNERQATFRVRP